MVIKRVGPVSCAKITGTLYAIIGLFVGIAMSSFSLLGGFASRNTVNPGLFAAFGVASIIIIPILYGAFGFVATLIGAWLYNVLAGIVGGIQIDIEPTSTVRDLSATPHLKCARDQNS